MKNSPDVAPRKAEYTFDTEEDVDPGEALPNPEAYPGCLVSVMQIANRGGVDGEGAREAVMSTVVDSDGRDFAMTCGRCAITLIHADGTVYGARKCPEARSGNISLGELA